MNRTLILTVPACPIRWSLASLCVAGLVWVARDNALAASSADLAYPEGATVERAAGGALDVVPCVVAPPQPDALDVLSPSEVHLQSWLGNRVVLNERNRLVRVDLEPLLAGFRQKPGVHPWIGEHIGKWMHAATLAWAYTGDPELRRKLDYAAVELGRAQEPDGYLGTYVPEKRFGLYPEADWDVWSHKYNLMGLLTYYQYTGNAAALESSRRIGDLLVATFPAQRSILAAGTHVGMAATSVLEPMVLLYRHTGDTRYLRFCRYLVQSWNDPGGPRIIASLLHHGQVNRTANGKAYEMLSNLVGLCELARATGDTDLLQPVLKAWQDVVSKRLYLTGACSQGEHFGEDFKLPNAMSAHVGEQCVTTTWIQLNWQLLRLTGQNRFAEQLERVFYNQLSAAQRPDGAQWCYFTAPEGTKPYGPGINCCVSSGPRGMALVPQSAVLRIPRRAGQPESILINLWESMTVRTQLGGQDTTILWQTGFPGTGQATLQVQSARPVPCAIRVRVPKWARPCTPSLVGGINGSVRTTEDTVTFAADDWTGTRASLRFNLAPAIVQGEQGNSGWSAFTWGPFVLAFDQQRNPGWPVPRRVVLPQATDPAALRLVSAPSETLRFTVPLAGLRQPESRPASLVTFADAGSDGGRYAVWLRASDNGLTRDDSLFAFAEETRNDPGNVEGSVADGDFDSFVVTFNGEPQPEAWFSVQLAEPQEFRRIVFAHGRAFHDGGWFDVQGGGKPRVQIKRRKEAAWETIGQITAYPETNAQQPAGLKDGQAFTLDMPGSLQAVALRVIGRPASGDDPRQSFASCAELQAFPEPSSGGGE